MYGALLTSSHLQEHKLYSFSLEVLLAYMVFEGLGKGKRQEQDFLSHHVAWDTEILDSKVLMIVL